MALDHNNYFDGAVQSIAFHRDGAKSSIGVMDVGSFHFGTGAPERMTVVQGSLTVRLPGSEEWRTFEAGASFEVPGDSGFDLRVEAATAYLCEYL